MNGKNNKVVRLDGKDITVLIYNNSRERATRRYGITRRSYHLRVENPPDTFPQGHQNIVRAFEEGLADAIEDLTSRIPDHDRIQIYLSSNRLQSAHTSANVTVGDWRAPLSGARRILDQISKMLNSNENFEVDDTLQFDLTHITMPEPGSGKRKWRFGTDSTKSSTKSSSKPCKKTRTSKNIRQKTHTTWLDVNELK